MHLFGGRILRLRLCKSDSEHVEDCLAYHYDAGEKEEQVVIERAHRVEHNDRDTDEDGDKPAYQGDKRSGHSGFLIVVVILQLVNAEYYEYRAVDYRRELLGLSGEKRVQDAEERRGERDHGKRHREIVRLLGVLLLLEEAEKVNEADYEKDYTEADENCFRQLFRTADEQDAERELEQDEQERGDHVFDIFHRFSPDMVLS